MMGMTSAFWTVGAILAATSVFKAWKSRTPRPQYFRDKVVWITGASSGIGKELARQLVLTSVGCKLILSSRDATKLEQVKLELLELGGKSRDIAIVPLDLADLKTLAGAFKEALDCFQGRIPDILVNNAGISQRSLARMTSFDVYSTLMEVDFKGPVFLSQLYTEKICSEKVKGHLVFVSSVAGSIPVPFRSGYCAAKSALNAYADVLRLELELENHPVSVTTISPGGVQTNVSANALNKDGVAFGEADQVTAEGMSVQECVAKMLVGISREADIQVVASRVEVFAYYLFKFLPVRTATSVIKVSSLSLSLSLSLPPRGLAVH